MVKEAKKCRRLKWSLVSRIDAVITLQILRDRVLKMRISACSSPSYVGFRFFLFVCFSRQRFLNDVWINTGYVHVFWRRIYERPSSKHSLLVSYETKHQTRFSLILIICHFHFNKSPEMMRPSHFLCSLYSPVYVHIHSLIMYSK